MVELIRQRPNDTIEPGDLRAWCSMIIQRLVPSGSLVLLIARRCNVEDDNETVVLLVGKHLCEFRIEATRSLSSHMLSMRS